MSQRFCGPLAFFIGGITLLLFRTAQADLENTPGQKKKTSAPFSSFPRRARPEENRKPKRIPIDTLSEGQTQEPIDIETHRGRQSLPFQNFVPDAVSIVPLSRKEALKDLDRVIDINGEKIHIDIFKRAGKDLLELQRGNESTEDANSLEQEYKNQVIPLLRVGRQIKHAEKNKDKGAFKTDLVQTAPSQYSQADMRRLHMHALFLRKYRHHKEASVLFLRVYSYTGDTEALWYAAIEMMDAHEYVTAIHYLNLYTQQPAAMHSHADRIPRLIEIAKQKISLLHIEGPKEMQANLTGERHALQVSKSMYWLDPGEYMLEFIYKELHKTYAFAIAPGHTLKLTWDEATNMTPELLGEDGMKKENPFIHKIEVTIPP